MHMFCLLAAAAGWFGLVLQYVVAFGDRRGMALAAGTLNYLSYFTVLTNLMGAVVLTAAGLGAGGRLGQALTRPSVAGAAALYMAVTGLVYVTVLRHLWQPEGWHFVADALLHYVMPALYLLYWLLGVPKGRLRPRHAALWLIFPVAYGIYTLARGPFAGFYPYPFIDADAIGYPAALRNMLAMTAGFALLGCLLLWLDRALGRRRAVSAGRPE